ncbi:T9SS type A sorting domain-containing protein [Patiriisocius sp. Uisw_017]|jgi:hypothetical protein|uniref:T9SS type A sorting domain-containing protein n=1 Tax=Patiriisocius sp. Uisw_017 TaxID=3230968 RepID=UPI0039ECCC05
MKIITLIAALFASVVSFAQIAKTSFEIPDAVMGQYTDTGDANVAHDLINNAMEPLVDFTAASDEMGFNASYTPYDTPSEGLTDGDFVGVTSFQPTGDIGFTDGVQGYQISDADGNFILEFDVVSLAGASNPGLTMDYFVSGNPDPMDSSYEGDGTQNSSGSDRLRIFVRDLTNNNEVVILDTTGSDIDDLGIEGAWVSSTANLLPDTMIQLVIEARMNATSEAFFFDNIVVEGVLGNQDIAANQFAVYPNPANDFVNITSKNRGTVEVSVYNILGKQIIATQVTNRLNIASLSAGVYLLNISQNGTSTTKKLVVK